MAPIKNIILVHGDCSSLPEKILQIKKHFFPGGDLLNNWVEIQSPLSKRQKEIDPKWFNHLDAELSYSSWDDGKKIILLRELVDNAQFLDFIFNAIQKISSNNYMVLCDSANVIQEGKAKTDNCDWKKLFEYCKKNAHMVNLGSPLKSSSKEEQVKFVIDAFSKKEKEISSENSMLLMEIVGVDRSFINSEIEKICMIVDNKSISKDDIINVAFPISQDYPVWQFYSSISTGSFTKMMDAATKLVNGDFNLDSILLLSMKQLRWHVICSSQLLNRGTINLKDFEKSQTKDKVIEKLLKNKCMDPRIYNQMLSETEKKERKSENVPSFYNLKDIQNFIENILPNFIEKPVTPHSVMTKTIERYLSVYDGIYELRTCGKEMSDIVFSNTIKKISVLK